jgi:MoaA/NifB/PqqE/SkfB family radical SAM enzyme
MKKAQDAVFVSKFWISLTGLCNNNCIFCLDGERKDRFHKDVESIKKEIKKAKDEGATRLVLSGGEPTIFPQIIDIVRYGRSIGFDRIQTISNGRMYAYKRFTKDMVDAGLNEVTFSIHGPNSKVHDAMTRVPGSFRESILGLKNISSVPGMIYNTDTVVTRLNYRHLLQTVRILHERYNVWEMNLMNIVPQGNSMRYRDKVLYDYGLVMPEVKRVIDYCRKTGIYIWLSRFPERQLEGYEDFIQDAHKMIDDVRGTYEIFENNDQPPCETVRCRYCGVAPICDKIFQVKAGFREQGITKLKKPENELVLETSALPDLQSTIRKISEKGSIIRIRYPRPVERLEDCERLMPRFSDLIPRLVQAIKDTGKIKDIQFIDFPFCIIEDAMTKAGIPHYSTQNRFMPVVKPSYLNKGKLDYIRVAQDLCLEVRTNPLVCDSCMMQGACQGIFKKYMRLYGASELRPRFCRELRIGLRCNQDCIFCNTDAGAVNMISDEKKIKEKIREWSRQGIELLVISGGEPTLMEDLPSYITMAKGLGAKHIELQTNAVEISQEYAKQLSEAGLKRSFVSFHAIDEKTNALITRAPGTFKKTVEGINSLLREKIDVIPNIVANTYNYRQLKDIVIFIHGNFPDIRSLAISFVAPLCAAKKNAECIPMISKTLPFLKEAIDYCKKNSIDIRIPARCGIPPCFLPGYEDIFDALRESRRWNDTGDKTKLEVCSRCCNNSRCSGLWDFYIALHGSDEFRSYANRYVKGESR